MTSEQRLDRLERIAKLFIRAGLRSRKRMSELDEKIKLLIDAQMQSEDKLRRTQMKNENELHLIQMRNEEELRKMHEDMNRRSGEVFELFRLTDEKISRLTEAN